jgi:hypothetical protein
MAGSLRSEIKALSAFSPASLHPCERLMIIGKKQSNYPSRIQSTKCPADLLGANFSLAE